MSANKEDFRTNRADYLLAAKKGRATADDRNELLAREMCQRDWRLAALAANPCSSLPEPRKPNRPFL
ncbi:hypothetical protein EN828_04560 [Mesorhizobium sp. M2D.F.Ca.ET.185.01.1.1]|nr:hypothetical protein EN783_18270 [Mesorhizobium sp. M2D.F.Ca.ET.140.01.1.1]TGP16478.1 hypothetical protein EN876_17185 [Mesorhizobium sp. M2D.F.Ca.ET.233.01.1.1]TGP36842.1 hypothetical protein EN875_004560 [Mesorhizobium sp. M2D.F.Ca.ET.232.01.1.1]TGP65576.1 hypothetical protein EN869_000895 [Mesorhizobium sp. M2D.F.Ca.ET.226.01.1.1]TGP72057.1 hypothetical protein EN868_00895 [Mesorhizobium sp. M2D.F.Ca.ET.225.01.1.1]TGP74708.1 hypothetical protein EN867_18785 [Mesorhizobium sp. M2D.F.Ca.ET